LLNSSCLFFIFEHVVTIAISRISFPLKLIEQSLLQNYYASPFTMGKQLQRSNHARVRVVLTIPVIYVKQRDDEGITGR
jgi:hypothetical protein